MKRKPVEGMTFRRSLLLAVPIWLGLLPVSLIGLSVAGLPDQIGWAATLKRLAIGGTLAYPAVVFGLLRYADMVDGIRSKRR